MFVPLQLSAIGTLLFLKLGQGFISALQNPCLSRLRRHSAIGAVPGADDWRDQAAQLRREIQEYEKEKSFNPIPQSASFVAPQNISDSCWQLTYRFNVGENNDDDANGQTTRESYGGTVNVKFLANGYTELLCQKFSGSRGATITKVWGWDIEVSPEDEQEYLLFSIDFKLSGERSDQRFYFQARHSQSPTVELAEGTITVKQDVVQNASRWPLFSPAGILAQFRFSGNFAAKPVG